MDFKPQLYALGLTKLETEAYLFLLSQGLSSTPQLSRGIKVARSNCYEILERLKEKSMIKEHAKGKRKVYTANDPLVLEQLAERRRQQIHELLPDLRTAYNAQKNKPRIEFFEGFDQVKNIFNQTLAAPEIFGIASTKQLFAHDPKFFTSYRKKIQEKGIIFHDIITHASGVEAGPVAKEQLRALYEMKFLPKEYEDLPVDILVWNDAIALIVSSETVFGTVLVNASLAKMFKILFGIIWKNL